MVGLKTQNTTKYNKNIPKIFKNIYPEKLISNIMEIMENNYKSHCRRKIMKSHENENLELIHCN